MAFRQVWAPQATTVALVQFPVAPHPGHRSTAVPVPVAHRPMVSTGGGWWQTVDDVPEDAAYGFSIDDGPVRPDPRGTRLPWGVHGPSAQAHLHLGIWGDEQWQGRDVRGCVQYEMHVGTFTAEGTFDAAITRLDHLVDLGVEAVELLPLCSWAGRWGWGYDGVALFSIAEQYGGAEGYQRFVAACHRRGLAVIVDVVYNHVGPAGFYAQDFGPYLHTGEQNLWGDGFNVHDDGHEEVRAHLLDNVRWWLSDMRADALRLDAVHAIYDESETHLLADISRVAHLVSDEFQQPRILIAETDMNDTRILAPVSEGGCGLDATWSDDLHHALHAYGSGERQGYYREFGGLNHVRQSLVSPFLRPTRPSWLQPNPSPAHVNPARWQGSQFVVYAQNHDQVGNRAAGERLHHITSADWAATCAALIVLSPYTPMLFMGEEWAASTPWQFFSDFCERDGEGLADRVHQGRRREFAEHHWNEATIADPQDPATFSASVLQWQELSQPEHQRMFQWYRFLIGLRKQVLRPALHDLRSFGVECGPDEDWLTTRWGPVRTTVNLSDQPAPVPPWLMNYDVHRTWGEPPTSDSLGRSLSALPAHRVVVSWQVD